MSNKQEKEMKKIAALSALTLLMVGCTSTQPTFDPNITEAKVIDGKTFNIPKGATPSPHIATQKEVEFYKKSGVADCKQGDVLWDAEGAKVRIAKAIASGNPDIHKELAKEGKIGCASPQ